MNPLVAMWQGTAAGAPGAPSEAIADELTRVSHAFTSDGGPLKLLPHERRQLRRIKAIAARDERLAINAIRVMTRRANEARRALKRGAHA